MFTTALHSGLLGALLTFAPRLWYPAYQTTTGSFGLTPVEDQQLGGLIMWIPAGLVYIAAGLVLFVGWLRESEQRASNSQPFGGVRRSIRDSGEIAGKHRGEQHASSTSTVF